MKRTTVNFDDNLHRALKLKAAEVSVPVSEWVNEAVRESLAEDAEDLAAFRDRENEPALDFETFVQQLKANWEVIISSFGDPPPSSSDGSNRNEIGMRLLPAFEVSPKIPAPPAVTNYRDRKNTVSGKATIKFFPRFVIGSSLLRS